MLTVRRIGEHVRRATVGGTIAHSKARHLPTERSITAMMRVKNEAEFLEAAVRSIAGSVDEIVLVDNGSTDGTPAIIAELDAALPHVTGYQYPYPVARVGTENARVAREARRLLPDEAGLRPLSALYNFSLSKCTGNWILKWDGDMIATAALTEALLNWRESAYLTMSYVGANVHPDRRHLVGARFRQAPSSLGEQAVQALPSWAEEMSWTARETWLFPRTGAHYDDGLRKCERLCSPFLPRDSAFARQRQFALHDPGFLHMKYCKTDPHSNHSAELAQVLTANVDLGPPLTEDQALLLDRWLPSGRKATP